MAQSKPKSPLNVSPMIPKYIPNAPVNLNRSRPIGKRYDEIILYVKTRWNTIQKEYRKGLINDDQRSAQLDILGNILEQNGLQWRDVPLFKHKK